MAHRFALDMIVKSATLPAWLAFEMVPPVRLERTLLAELDFESSASTIPPRGHADVLLAKPFGDGN